MANQRGAAVFGKRRTTPAFFAPFLASQTELHFPYEKGAHSEPDPAGSALSLSHSYFLFIVRAFHSVSSRVE